MNNKKIEELSEAIGWLKCVLKCRKRNEKIMCIKSAYLLLNNVIDDNVVYNIIRDYYNNLTLGDCYVSKKYVNYLIALILIENEE